MNFDPHYLPYPSRRQLLFAGKGAVATSQPLAAQIGLDVMKRGGNAMDAAVACAAAMTVLEPCSNGIGGDAFAILWSAREHRLRGLNASGFAPALLSEENIRARGFDAMPQYGLVPITVPGIPSAWAAMAEQYGTLPLAELVEGAAKLAEEGFPVSPTTARYWGESEEVYHRAQQAATDRGDAGASAFRYWFDVFAPGGKCPKAGELFRIKAHAETLREIGRTGAESFYRGAIAGDIDTFMKREGGFLRFEDLAAFYPEWVDPISVNYRGYDIWEIPPNGQGLVALMGLNILENFDFPFGKDHPDTYHKQIEALKLAFADGHEYIGDPRSVNVDLAALLSKDYARNRAVLIGETALEPEPGRLAKSGTVYLCAVDPEGNMVSWIQSNYNGFGSGIVLPERGIAFQNRGYGFTLDRNSVKYVTPGKRPFHTIIPGFITRDGQPLGPFGIMGGPMQPQAHLQAVSSLIDFNLNPQAALDAPRWLWDEGKRILLEPEFPYPLAEALRRRGHDIQYSDSDGPFGRGQLILRMPNGVYAAGTEKRTDGYVALW
ncbi:gamma-glutamyltransferase [Spirochaetia bacterium]|nr:gamma-glutamyltransferase [Spirochaetia bacterium]